MAAAQLENLVRIGQLRREAPVADELAGLKRSAQSRLADATRPDLSFASRFDLAYNAAHARCDPLVEDRKAATVFVEQTIPGSRQQLCRVALANASYDRLGAVDCCFCAAVRWRATFDRLAGSR